MMDKLSRSCKGFDLNINLVMFQLAPVSNYIVRSIFVDGHVKKTTDGFADLKDRFWSQIVFQEYTKMTVYRACVLTFHLYILECTADI